MAAELLLCSGRTLAVPLHPDLAPVTVGFAEAVGAMAHDHLQSVALGASLGPDLAGSLRIRRLAAAPGAPPDQNQDGSNLDETSAAEAQRLADRAGAQLPEGGRQPLGPWLRAASRLREPWSDPVRTPPPPSWRLLGLQDLEPRQTLVDLADAIRARVTLAGTLLAASRGTSFGATPQEGLLGLVAVGQALAIEEQLLSGLFTDGIVLGPLSDPETYDPRVERRWLPATVAAVLEPGTDERPGGYLVVDGASDLEGLAAALEAAVELAWMAGENNPSPELRRVFGLVFPPPEPQPPDPVLSWDIEIRPLVQGRCGACHLGFGSGGYRVDNLAATLHGSPRTRAMHLPMVVPGDHQSSLLYNILLQPPAPIRRMPTGAPLPQGEIDRIAEWIDQGAFESPPQPPAPPRAGETLLRVAFANLVAMHLERQSGALLSRVEADGSSLHAEPAATGRALVALARLHRLDPTLSFDGLSSAQVLESAAAFAAERLVRPDGRVLAAYSLADGPSSDMADLGAHAALTSGLFASAAELPGSGLSVMAAASAETLVERMVEPGTTRLRAGQRWTARQLAYYASALRWAWAVGLPGIADVLEGTLLRLRPVVLPAEWSDGGLGDGIADTDQDGLLEPAAAGELPVLASAVLTGDVEVGPTAEITWSRHVRPSLVAPCGACHMGGVAEGGYRLDTASQAMLAGDSMGHWPMVVPGSAEGSFLYRKLVDRLPAIGAQMPLGQPPLDPRSLEVVRRWIDEGASRR